MSAKKPVSDHFRVKDVVFVTLYSLTLPYVVLGMASVIVVSLLMGAYGNNSGLALVILLGSLGMLALYIRVVRWVWEKNQMQHSKFILRAVTTVYAIFHISRDIDLVDGVSFVGAAVIAVIVTVLGPRWLKYMKDTLPNKL